MKGDELHLEPPDNIQYHDLTHSTTSGSLVSISHGSNIFLLDDWTHVEYQMGGVSLPSTGLIASDRQSNMTERPEFQISELKQLTQPICNIYLIQSCCYCEDPVSAWVTYFSFWEQQASSGASYESVTNTYKAECSKTHSSVLLRGKWEQCGWIWWWSVYLCWRCVSVCMESRGAQRVEKYNQRLAKQKEPVTNLSADVTLKMCTELGFKGGFSYIDVLFI